jgi:hypothetical protein
MSEPQDERLGLPSASSWQRYELCAGSWALEQEAKRLGQEAHTGSAAARHGTRIHAYLSGTLDEDGNEIVLDEDEQRTADFLQERAQEQALRIFGDEPTQQLHEKRLWLELGGKKAASGRFDRVVYTPSVALVQDFKTGWHEPDPAEQNSQMKMLAVLVALHMPKTLREVVVQIVSGPFGVSEARYDRASLAKAWDAIMGTLQAIQAPNAPLNPSPEACKVCPAAMICQPCRDLLSPPTKFQTTTLPDDPDRAAKLLDEIAVLEGVFEEVKKYYADRLTTDPAYRITDYAMMQGAPRRAVTDWVAGRARLEEFIDANVLDSIASFSIPAVEKLLAQQIGIKGNKVKDKLAEILGPLLELKYPDKSLKRVSGKPKLVEVNLP